MHYETHLKNHGLRHDPFKALVVPRPIGWVATVSREGVRNLAPYSFFNMVSDQPPMVIISSEVGKDSITNILETGEFTCSLVTKALHAQMNMTSAKVDAAVDEFELAGLAAAPSAYVKPPRVAESPAALECRLWKAVSLPPPDGQTESHYTVLFGRVVGVYIDDAVIRDGRVDMAAIEPVARLGYMDYTVVNAASIFSANRPDVAADGRTAVIESKPWDGQYR